MKSGRPAALWMSPKIDPAARLSRKRDEEWQTWLGWTTAAMLHGGLLAALIFSWPARLNPVPPNSATVSLLLVADRPAGLSAAVQPKPPATPATLPTIAPVRISNGTPARHPKPRSKLSGISERLPNPGLGVPAPAGRVASRPVTQQDGDGFVAALPVTGNVNQPPEYPAAAYDHGEQGDVLLSIHVLANGTADSVSVTQSSGYDILDQAAVKAVWKWRFQPSTLSGQAVPSVIPYRIRFDLQAGHGSG